VVDEVDGGNDDHRKGCKEGDNGKHPSHYGHRFHCLFSDPDRSTLGRRSVHEHLETDDDQSQRPILGPREERGGPGPPEPASHGGTPTGQLTDPVAEGEIYAKIPIQYTDRTQQH
jgi:hypothetical protein